MEAQVHVLGQPQLPATLIPTLRQAPRADISLAMWQMLRRHRCYITPSTLTPFLEVVQAPAVSIRATATSRVTTGWSQLPRPTRLCSNSLPMLDSVHETESSADCRNRFSVSFSRRQPRGNRISPEEI